jgi:hypothetical protein
MIQLSELGRRDVWKRSLMRRGEDPTTTFSFSFGVDGTFDEGEPDRWPPLEVTDMDEREMMKRDNTP